MSLVNKQIINKLVIQYVPWKHTFLEPLLITLLKISEVYMHRFWKTSEYIKLIVGFHTVFHLRCESISFYKENFLFSVT